MLNTAKTRKERRKHALRKLASLADRFEGHEPIDKQDSLLAGLDDGWEHIRQAVIKIAGERGEWAGYPLPVENAELVIEPRHPLQSLNGASFKQDEAEPEPTGPQATIVNQWIDRRGWTIGIVREADGRFTEAVWPKNPSAARFGMLLDTLGASQAWSVDAEFTAMARLKTLIATTAFRYYLLVGAFLETSPRSKVMYVFRKGRPTVAMSFASGYSKPLTALCLHPIGYYKGTHAGSMVPTDDVIAHLLMMRGDERRFWSKCQHHPLEQPESGV